MHRPGKYFQTICCAVEKWFCITLSVNRKLNSKLQNSSRIQKSSTINEIILLNQCHRFTSLIELKQMFGTSEKLKMNVCGKQ